MAVPQSIKPMAKKNSTNRMIIGLLGVLLALAVSNLHLPGVSSAAMGFLGLLLLTVIIWALEIVPAGIGGLILLIGTVAFHYAPPAVAFSGFTEPVLYLIIAGLILGIAVDVTGLGRRLAYYILARVGAESPWRIVFAFFLIGVILTQMIPTVFGRLAVLIPLGLGLAEILGVEKGSRYGKFLMAVVFFASQQFLLVTMTGMEPTLVAVGELAKQGQHIFWGQFFVMWVIPGIILTSLVYIPLMWFLFKPSSQEANHPSRKELLSKLGEMGPWTKKERNVLIIFGLVILFWATDFLTHFSPAVVAVAGMIALFLPGVDVIDVNEVRRLNLLNIIFFGSALSIGGILGHLHLSKTFAALFRQWLPASHLTYGSSFALAGLVQLLHVPLSTVTSTIATLTPILANWAKVAHISPLIVTWIALSSAANAWIFPYQVEPLLMVYNEGYWSIWDIIKMGVFMSVVSLLLTALFAVTWWPFTVHLLFGS